MKLLAVGLVLLFSGWFLGVLGTAYVLGVYDAHTRTVVRVCWEQVPPGTEYRRRFYETSADTIGRERVVRFRDKKPGLWSRNGHFGHIN